jgi:hypothetical protein
LFGVRADAVALNPLRSALMRVGAVIQRAVDRGQNYVCLQSDFLEQKAMRHETRIDVF